MNSEIYLLKTKLAEAENKLILLDMEAANHIITIRQRIHSHQDDITLLETEEALVALNRLNAIKKEMIELRTKIQRLKNDLGV